MSYTMSQKNTPLDKTIFLTSESAQHLVEQGLDIRNEEQLAQFCMTQVSQQTNQWLLKASPEDKETISKLFADKQIDIAGIFDLIMAQKMQMDNTDLTNFQIIKDNRNIQLIITENIERNPMPLDIPQDGLQSEKQVIERMNGLINGESPQPLKSDPAVLARVNRLVNGGTQEDEKQMVELLSSEQINERISKIRDEARPAQKPKFISNT